MNLYLVGSGNTFSIAEDGKVIADVVFEKNKYVMILAFNKQRTSWEHLIPMLEHAESEYEEYMVVSEINKVQNHV